MFKEIIKEVEWGGATLSIKTGKIARQADGAVLVSMGDTVVLCTSVSAKEQKDDASFFPLTIHYREMAFAAGKIPGGFFKREGKTSEREVLVSRLIDRPLRPLFDENFRNETQVICTVLSHDPKYCSDIIAMIGASAAVAISGAPLRHVIAGAKVGYIDGQYVLNPSFLDLENSKLDLVVAGTDTSVMMVESEAHELSEEEMLGAVEFGHKAMQPVIAAIEELKREVGKLQIPTKESIVPEALKTIEKEFSSKIETIYQIQNRSDRNSELAKLKSEIFTAHSENYPELIIHSAFEELKYKVVRKKILNEKLRIDGRNQREIRQIECETGILPRAHGSSLFTRGETQSVVAATLGTSQDEQIFESLDGEGRDRFLLHYIFPPYSVGEYTPLKAPGRREIGHGKLAWRAINPVLPKKEDFPYTMRIVSEITESNGSSSMATVCGASMALMDAGVPIKSPVAGIAMGLIKEGEEFVVLSDIMGDEDYLGDMDFKVAGTAEGITALQMDIKVTGINTQIMKIALSEAKDGRNHIISKMEKAITNHNSLSVYAPQIVSMIVPKDKIREIIGPGGKMIKEICEISGAKIEINDDGVVNISAVGSEKIDIARQRIQEITYEPKTGDILFGKVVKILDSGAFVAIPGGKDGYLHISEISSDRIPTVESALTVDQKVKVKIIDFDRGKLKLSIKALESDYLVGSEDKIRVTENTGGADNSIDTDGESSSSPRTKKSSFSRDRGASRGDSRGNSRGGSRGDSRGDSRGGSRRTGGGSARDGDSGRSRSNEFGRSNSRDLSRYDGNDAGSGRKNFSEKRSDGNNRNDGNNRSKRPNRDYANDQFIKEKKYFN